jgi:hypothetical protein
LIVPQPVTTPSPETLRVRHAKIDAAVFDEHVVLFERAFIQKDRQTLARGQLAFFVLVLDTLRTAALPGLVAPRFQLIKHTHETALPPVRT